MKKVVFFLLCLFVRLLVSRQINLLVDDNNNNGYFLRDWHTCQNDKFAKFIDLKETINVPLAPYHMSGQEWLEAIKLVENRLDCGYAVVEFGYSRLNRPELRREYFELWRLKSGRGVATKQMWFVDHPRSDGAELVLEAKEFCDSLGDDWDCLFPIFRGTICVPYLLFGAELMEIWLEQFPEYFTVDAHAVDLKHVMQILSTHYQETYFYALSGSQEMFQGGTLLNEFFRCNPGRIYAASLYPGSVCPYDGITMVNTTVSETLQKISIEVPVHGVNTPCSIFMLGESDMKGMRDKVELGEIMQMTRQYDANDYWIFSGYK